MSNTPLGLQALVFMQDVDEAAFLTPCRQAGAVQINGDPACYTASQQ